MTADEPAVQDRIARRFASVDALSSYRRSLDEDRAAGIADVSLAMDVLADYA